MKVIKSLEQIVPKWWNEERDAFEVTQDISILEDDPIIEISFWKGDNTFSKKPQEVVRLGLHLIEVIKNKKKQTKNKTRRKP